MTNPDENNNNSQKTNNRNIRVFISYRNHEPSEDEAENLAMKLKDRDYIVFHDKDRLHGGQSWKQEIIHNVRESDVLIVLLQAAKDQDKDADGSENGEKSNPNDDGSTHKSEWVQREVDVARGANVSILPITIYGQAIRIPDVQIALGIDELQYEEYASAEYIANIWEDEKKQDAGKVTAEEKKKFKEDAEEKSQKRYERLIDIIEILATKTRKSQLDWNQHLRKIRAKPKASTNQNRFTTKITDTNTTLHLAAGDILDMKDIDVIVNSENDYMQMARIHESYTLSSALRMAGAYVEQGRLREDRVQEELDDQVKTQHDCGLPVMIGEVIVTHAGDPRSELIKRNNARYIFHAATMRHETLSKRNSLQPIATDEGIEKVTLNCLRAFVEVNNQKGRVLKEDSRYFKAQEAALAEKKFTPIKSIVFPIFGTGHGGRSIHEVVPPMVRSFRHFLKDNPEADISNIYLSVYAEADIKMVKEIIEAVMGKKYK